MLTMKIVKGLHSLPMSPLHRLVQSEGLGSSIRYL